MDGLDSEERAELESEWQADGSRSQLQQELQQLNLRELRMRAAEEGVDADAIEDARDGDSPKEDVSLESRCWFRNPAHPALT